ncbi:MAG: hypothetical protein EZS28_011986 [Streblomastix strix]|uniref:Uncharacterized protein n=1 Tax=Streblomastix strix TaxID=222440 RepID=A0A5J4WC14_9EUKA|nr:MAG: hypothetical protein EZS28_011986 [Streblomastix strix]
MRSFTLLLSCCFIFQQQAAVSSNDITENGFLYQADNSGQLTWTIYTSSPWPIPTGKNWKFEYDAAGTYQIETFQVFSSEIANNFIYFEIGGIRTKPLFKADNGSLHIQSNFIHDIILDDCSLIELNGPTLSDSASTAEIELNFCYFEKITLRNSPDFPCCVVIVRVSDIEKYTSFTITFFSSIFANIQAGNSGDPTFHMTSASDYAPVMITYDEYPAIQTSQCNCTVIFEETRFISTHGSHTGAIDIRGEIGQVIIYRTSFSKTIAEDGVRFTPDAVYGNCVYASGSDDIMRMASEFIYLCRSDSDAPKIAVQSSLDFGAFDNLIPDYKSTLVVSEMGSDSIGTGSELNPLRTINTAVAVSNPKKKYLIEKIVDQNEYPITVIIKAGLYIERRIKVFSERMTLKGEGVDITRFRNDINDSFNPSQLLSIEPDNVGCKLDIIDISFEQVFAGTSIKDPLFITQYGEVNLQRCSFKQVNPSNKHESSFIQINNKDAVLTNVIFTEGNFNSETAAIEIVPGGGLKLDSCNFTNIIGSVVIRAVLSDTFTDLILRDCKFLNCQSNPSIQPNIPSGSTIIISSSFITNFANQRVNSFLISPVCTFTRCQFTGNSGESEIKFLGNLFIVGFVQCNIDSTSILYLDQWTPTYWNEIKSYSFGGCSGSDQNAIVYINSTGLDSGTGIINNPFRSLSQAINQKTQGGQSILTLQIGQGTCEDDGLNIGARSISFEGAGINETILMNKITSRIWLAFIVGGRLNIKNVGLRQSSSSEYYGGMLVLRGDGTIDLINVNFKQREYLLKQSTNTIYATAGDIIIADSIFEKASFINYYNSTSHISCILCEDKFESFTITNSSISQQYTSFVESPTADEILYQNEDEFGCGAFVFMNVQQLKFIQCNFTQNQGWRTGSINIHQMSKKWTKSENELNSSTQSLTLNQCNFDNNSAVMDQKILNSSLKKKIGNDIILDHEYTKQEIVQSFSQTNSSSSVPKIGSVHNQYLKGTLDFALYARRTAETSYVSIQGVNLITGVSGQLLNPYQTIQYAIYHTKASQYRAAQIFIFPGVFIEVQLFIGGNTLTITGTAEGLTEPVLANQTSTRLGLSEICTHKDTQQDLIEVYDGVLTLQLITFRIDNSDSIPQTYSMIVIHGSLASVTIEYCSFKTVIPTNYLDKEFFSLDKGGNLTMRYTYIEQTSEKYRPLIYIAVSEKSNVIFQYFNITSCEVVEASSGVMHFQYFTGGTATFENCYFLYNIVLDPSIAGKKPFGGALLIELRESSFSEQLGSEGGWKYFDSNIGDCSGAVTVTGTRSLLSEERIHFIRCEFENNIAGSNYIQIDVPHGNDIYFYIIDASSILYNETLSSGESTKIQSSFFTQCSSYNYSPLVNYLGNKVGTEKLDQLLLYNVIYRQFVIYVSNYGDHINSGEKHSPLMLISHALAVLNRSDGYKEIIAFEGWYDEPMLVIRNIILTVTGAGSHVTAISNTLSKEKTVFWAQKDSNIIVQDFTLFRRTETSYTAALFDCDAGSNIIVKRCNLYNDLFANFGDIFNAGIFHGLFTSGGIFDTVIQNSIMTYDPVITLDSKTGDFNFNLIQKTADNKCEFKSGLQPESNPPFILFEFYNVTFRNASTTYPLNPFIRIVTTPSMSVTFNLCIFERCTNILIQLSRSYFNPDYGQIGQIIFKHCIWNSNGYLWNAIINDWKSAIQIESGAISVQYADFPTELDYAINSDCNINTGNIVVENCVFMDNAGTIANDILIEEDLLTKQLITFKNCAYGKESDLNFASFTYELLTKTKMPSSIFTIQGFIDYLSSSAERNIIINSTSTLNGGQLTQFVAMMLKYDPSYNIQFQKGIIVEETTLNVRYNKLSIFKDDNIQEEVIFIAKQSPHSKNYDPFQQYGAFIDPYSSPLIAVEQTGEISMKSIVILHFYEKSLNSVIEVKDDAIFNGIQLIFRPIVEQLVGMATLPTTEQTSPYLLCLGGFTILEQCRFLQTNFINSEAIRTFFQVGYNSPQGITTEYYTLTLNGCIIIGMNRIDESENSGSAIDAIGMKITLESCLFDMNIQQQSNMVNNKINKQDQKSNEDEQTQPEAHLIPTCGWNTAYIRQNTGSLILTKGTQLINLNQGAISLLGAALTIVDADVQFINNIDSSYLQGIHSNEDEDEPVIIKPTLLRRNIVCGYGSRITSPIESFTENGLQEDSLWILKTDEGKLLNEQQQQNSECQLSGGLRDIKSPLFIPHIDKVSGIMSKDKLGLDITIIGRHLVRCGVVKYKICEKMKVTNDDGQEIEEKVKERELHCKTELMENSLHWENETEIVIQTRYKTVRKWKTMEIWLVFADYAQISEILTLSIGKLSTSAIVTIVLICLLLIGLVISVLVVILCYNYKQKKKVDEMRQIEEEIERQSNQVVIQQFD